MPALKPIKRRRLIQNLRALGFDGPYSGGNHQYMVKGERKLFIPNPHSGDISAPLSTDCCAKPASTAVIG